MKNRVCTLYRVSTDKQVDHNDKNQADIPMQRKSCHAFCEKMGWTIVHEEREDGESEKTSIRTKTALGQLVEDEGFKGGVTPYGYDLVTSGRVNKRKH